jgi:hypothetical protein
VSSYFLDIAEKYLTRLRTSITTPEIDQQKGKKKRCQFNLEHEKCRKQPATT